MQTKIRHFRKMRGLTLRDLADLVGTTPQTVQRLETANMTVSTDWLEKIAQALNVRVVDLLDEGRGGGIQLLGVLGRGDRIAPGPESDTFTIDVPADDPVAIEITDRCGPYSAGTILIGNRYSGDNLANASGRNAIVSTRDGTLALRRVVLLADSRTYSLVSLHSGGEITHGAQIDWAAPIVMTVTYE